MSNNLRSFPITEHSDAVNTMVNLFVYAMVAILVLFGWTMARGLRFSNSFLTLFTCFVIFYIYFSIFPV